MLGFDMGENFYKGLFYGLLLASAMWWGIYELVTHSTILAALWHGIFG